MSNRDDFSEKVKKTLCERVNGKCSNPSCGKETLGPHSNSQKRISIGQAAHITAASEGGPRYDPYMTPEERKSIDNGIWLCDSCAKLIDSDEELYTVEMLKEWKKEAEAKQRDIINQRDNIPIAGEGYGDIEKIAYREAKKALDNLHEVLQYAYSYWEDNFKNQYEGLSLESELIRRWKLYSTDLYYIYIRIEESKNNLHRIMDDYSLDLGNELSGEIKRYCDVLAFHYQSDDGGVYNNYWRCFFEMISANMSFLNKCKNKIDEFLFQAYK